MSQSFITKPTHDVTRKNHKQTRHWNVSNFILKTKNNFREKSTSHIEPAEQVGMQGRIQDF